MQKSLRGWEGWQVSPFHERGNIHWWRLLVRFHPCGLPFSSPTISWVRRRTGVWKEVIQLHKRMRKLVQFKYERYQIFPWAWHCPSHMACCKFSGISLHPFLCSVWLDVPEFVCGFEECGTASKVWPSFDFTSHWFSLCSVFFRIGVCCVLSHQLLLSSLLCHDFIWAATRKTY